MSANEKALYAYAAAAVAGLAAAGLAADGPSAAFAGFLALQAAPTRLLSDFTLIGGAGGALLNAAVMGALSFAVVLLVKVRLSGPTFATAFTMMGFAFFGTTPANALPLMAGVFLASRIARVPFNHYVLIAFFGTSLGPVVDFLVFDAGLRGPLALLAGPAAGVAAGCVLPALAMSMLRLHEGFSLYNIGLTAGFIGLFVSSLIVAAGADLSLVVIWNEAPSPLVGLCLAAAAALAVVWGLGLEGGGAFRGWTRILRLSGRLPSDFMELASPGAALVNMGAMGLFGCAYVAAVGGDFNGPVVGSLFTVMGFSAFGKHPRNCLPVVAGVVASSLVFGKDLSAPGPLIAALLGTTLAPLAGEFGPAVGFAAGFLHLALVERTAAWHGGLSLYNNGFSGGLVAALVVAVLEWYRSHREGRK